MKRIFVMGDIHGAYSALKQCLQRSFFDYENDILINLGDVCDGWPQTKDCIHELLKIKNLIYILGNHDTWCLTWMQTGVAENTWLTQGGEATVSSYSQGVPESHIKLLHNALPYYIFENKLFVHAGINSARAISEQNVETFLWDRSLAKNALEDYGFQAHHKHTIYDEVYLGHTPIRHDKPIQSGEVWLMDTGAGWAGVLSMMEINSKEIFTSDAVPLLYPGIEGRTKK